MNEQSNWVPQELSQKEEVPAREQKQAPARSAEELQARLAAEKQAREKAPKKETAPPQEILAAFVKKASLHSAVLPRTTLELHPPEGLDQSTLTALLDTPSHDDEALCNLAFVVGAKDTYYYDQTVMTQNYAKVAALLEDKDLLATIASTARFDSKTYPRPTRMVTLQDSPYHFSEDEILGAVARMKLGTGYEDIDTVTASNGKLCIYSTRFLSKKYAQALCEELEVERYQNQ